MIDNNVPLESLYVLIIVLVNNRINPQALNPKPKP